MVNVDESLLHGLSRNCFETGFGTFSPGENLERFPGFFQLGGSIHGKLSLSQVAQHDLNPQN